MVTLLHTKARKMTPTKYRVTVFHPTFFERLRGKDLQVSLEKFDGRSKAYKPVRLDDVTVRDVRGTNKG